VTDAAVPRPPASAEALFGERLPLARRYAELLCTDGVLRGVIGPRESERIWPRHLLNSAAVGQLVARHARVIDVGSGAGLPGIPLALARPDLDVTLLEPLARRVAFLEDVVAALGLPVRVVRERAENAAGADADTVVARAVAPLERLVPVTMPLLRVGGQLLALKGATAGAELDAAGPTLARLGVSAAEVVAVELPDMDQLTVIRCVAGPDQVRSGRAGRAR